MSYAQFGYSPFPTTTQLMVGTSVNSNSVSSSPCCGGGSGGGGNEQASGRGPTGVPTENPTVAAAAVLPATYETRLISTYPRLTPTGLYSAHPSPYAEQPYPNFESSAFYPSLSSPYGMKDAGDPWRGFTPSASYCYDPSFAAYGYGGLDFNGARRKNVTRDSTSTLKAWLNEHRKNPYPTKGEKIMLAIITKMTLTQVSTWFANARRRLKKENKMTWEPRNKMDSDDVKDFDDDDDDVVSSKNDRNVDNDTDNNTTVGREPLDNTDRRPSHAEDIRSSRSDSESSDDGGRQLTSGDNSVDGMLYRPSEVTLGSRSGYHLLRHSNSMTMSLCDRPEERINRPDAGLPRTDFTPADSSSPTNMPDIQSLMRSPRPSRDGGNSALEDSKRSSSEQLSSGNGQDQMSGSKPKIWSLADTATSKTPPVAGGPLIGIEGSGTVAEMLGHCGWFSMNPYHHQVNGGSPINSSSAFGGYPHPSPPAPSLTFMTPNNSGTSMFSNGSGGVPAVSLAHGLSPVPPQTDTPPQTPPNMKVSSALPSLGGSCSYNIGQNASAHLYTGQASTAMCSSGAAISSSMNAKSVNGYHRTGGNRTYRPELPEDFSSTGQYR